MGIRARVAFEDENNVEHFGSEGRTAYEGKWFFEPPLLELYLSDPALNLLEFFGENTSDQWFECADGIARFTGVIQRLREPEVRALFDGYDDEEFGSILQTLEAMRQVIHYAQTHNKRFHLVA